MKKKRLGVVRNSELYYFVEGDEGPKSKALPTYLPACLPTYLPTYLPACLPTYRCEGNSKTLFAVFTRSHKNWLDYLTYRYPVKFLTTSF